MTSTDARTAVPRLVRELAAERTHLKTLATAEATLAEREATWTTLADERPLTGYEQDALRAYRDARRALDGDGLPAREGLPSAVEFLAPLVGTPGRAATERRIARLEEQLAEARAVLDRWPSADTRHPFRYVGPPRSAMFDGRWAKPGDVHLLNESQAWALRDRFEAVEAEPVPS